MAFPVLKRAEAGNSNFQLGDICFQVLVELYSVTAFNLYERAITHISFALQRYLF